MSETLRLAHFTGPDGEAVALIDPAEELDSVEDFAPYGMELVSVVTVMATHPPSFPGNFPINETFRRDI